MFLYDHLGSSESPKCATGVVLPADYLNSTDTAYLPGFGPGGASEEAPKKSAIVPLLFAAAVGGVVIWWIARNATPVLANPGRKLQWQGSGRDAWARFPSDDARQYTDKYRVSQRGTGEWVVSLETSSGTKVIGTERTPALAKRIAQQHAVVSKSNPGRAQKLGFTAADADPEQLRVGTEHELEHTGSRKTARRIALDHLAETPDYYTRLATIEPNPSRTTAEQWNKLRADYLEADSAYDALDSELSYKYGSRRGYEWASTTERKKLEQLRKRKDHIGEKMFVILDKVAARDWHHGVPAHWIYSELTWEDAIRPANEPLSVTPPTAYGY